MFSIRVLPLVILLLCGEVFASTLTVGQGSVQPGETAVTVPLTLTVSSGDIVAALQTDVGFNSDALNLSSISAGPSATAANKNVSFSVQAPGSVKVIIAGLNQTAIPDGVVANMVFEVKQSAIAGVQAILLDEVLAADPTGVSVPVNAISGGITVSATSEGEVGEGEGESGGEGEVGVAPGPCCVCGTVLFDDAGKSNAGDLLVLMMGAGALLLERRRINPSHY